MSVLLGLHAGRFVLLASDMRRTYYDADLKVVARHDNCRKLVASANGLMAGTGSVWLLQRVIARRPEITTASRFLEIIDEERTAVFSPLSPAMRSHPGMRTGWMMTTDSGKGLTIAAYHPMFGHKIGFLAAGGAISFVPESSPNEAACAEFGDELNARLDVGMRLCQPDDSVGDSISHHVAFVRELLAEAARRIPSISPTILIGLHTDAGQIRVTELSVSSVFGHANSFPTRSATAAGAAERRR